MGNTMENAGQSFISGCSKERVYTERNSVGADPELASSGETLCEHMQVGRKEFSPAGLASPFAQSQSHYPLCRSCLIKIR